MSLEELKLETSRDEILRKVKNILEVNSWQQFKQDPNIRAYFQIKDELSVVDGLICRGSRIIIPLTLQDRMMELAHEGHLNLLVPWSVQKDGIDDQKVSTLPSCNCTHNVREPLEMSPLPNYPWQKGAVDHAGPFPDGYYGLLVIDEY